MPSNNVTRLLDSRKVKYTAFETSNEKLGAIETAHLLNISPEIVFKTIVVLRDKPGKPVLAIIPGTGEVDCKKLAAYLKEKKVHTSTQKEAEQLTGLQTGGISPLALLNKGFLVVLDQSATQYPEIHISGGQRGLNIRLPVSDIITLTHAATADIVTPLVTAE